MLNGLCDRRATLVVAPAGYGKTTLLAQFSAAAGVPVAWYRSEATDGSEAMLLHALARSLAPVLGGPPRELACVEDLVAALEEWSGERAVLVVDDLHTVTGTPGEAVVERLLDYAPPSFHLMAASRSTPDFNLSRLRVSGEVLVISADDLRFRSWEVEQLFRDFYNEPLPPEDLAALARRTEGWAAGLQLFHLATRGRSTAERRTLVAELGSRSRMAREYLARNVLAQLSDDLRSFLLGTCVLGRLTGPLCDELLDRVGSHDILDELERQQLFTIAVGEEGAYRYHEILRAHLDSALVEALGEDHARHRYHEAGRLLQRAGALPDALRAFCRAEDWVSAARLLGEDGWQLAERQGSWLEVLPPDLLDDPWLLLARARREVALGRLADAVGTYERARLAFGSTSASDVCWQERQAVAVWVDDGPARRPDWISVLRAATQRDPLAAARAAAGIPAAAGRFTEGVALLLAGRPKDAAVLLETASDLFDVPPVLGVVARLLARAAALASGRPAEHLADIADEVDLVDVPWLSRLIRTVALLVATRGRSNDAVGVSSRHDADPWGAATVSLIEGVLRLYDGQPAAEVLEEAALRFRRLGAGVIEMWAHSGLAVALAAEERPEARQAALAAGRAARSAGVPSAEALALLALGLTEGAAGAEHLALARSLAEQCGLRLPPVAGGETGDAPPAVVPVPAGAPLRPVENIRVPPIMLGCFGGFRLCVDGRAVDGRGLKPRPRAVLHLLALHAGRLVHRDTLVEALWPEVDGTAGMRNLHVALSTIRRYLDPESTRGSNSLLAREGDAYRLALPTDSVVDIWRFEDGLAEGRTARAAGETEVAIAAIGQALGAYTGEVLPEAGPAEWVVMTRERYRMQASEAALALSELHLERGHPEAAVAVGESGVRIDRYRDAQWRVLITACELAGDAAAAARVRRSYADVLADLGVAPVAV
jgi:DNA-binding SARP family transcriptional activator